MNHSFDIEFKGFMKLYKNYIKEHERKAATIKRFEYWPLGSELKRQTITVKDQFQGLP